ncbi:MAG: cysteine desulfurase family protein [Candidatus Daviesbacteria bacterium]|nr:cysteine desulfurase family protein [Candidatus Daviesbacteria bacterium]
MKIVYLDHAATTSVDKNVFLAMKPYLLDDYGNPSQPHLMGMKAKKAIEDSRIIISKFLKCDPCEVIFTSCATESINLSHKGLIDALSNNLKKKAHIVTSSIEHKAVLETCHHLEKNNLAEITYLPVDEYGMVNICDIEKSIQENTVLVSIMYVNNEAGTIQPIMEIGKILKRINKLRTTNSQQRIYFHTDATQAIPYLNCDVNLLGVDLLSFSGHKINAPKGIGALFIKKGTTVLRQQDGGAQEFNLRSGTENVAFIAGLGEAIKNICKNRNSIKKIEILRDQLISQVLKIPGTLLTGHPKIRSPHIASFTVEGIEGEALILRLSDKGIMASSGSACTSQSLNPSHVLSAMGISPIISHGSIRFSLGKENTEKEIKYVIKILPKEIDKLRKMAPKL